MTRRRSRPTFNTTHQGNQNILTQIAAKHHLPLTKVRYVYVTEHTGARWTVRSDFEICPHEHWVRVDWVGDNDGCYGQSPPV